MVPTSHDPHIICTPSSHSEILRYFITKGGDKAKSAPNLTAIFDHFNRVSHSSVLCVCVERGNIHLPPSLPPSQDVPVLHVECGVPGPPSRKDQGAGISHFPRWGVPATEQFQLSHANHVCNSTWVHQPVQDSLGMHP